MAYKSVFIPVLMLLAFFSVSASEKTPTKDQVMDLLIQVNNTWQKSHPKHERAFWDNAAYHTGNMEVYFLTGNEAYRKYSEEWARQNKWMGAKSADKSLWKYQYGETDEHVLFGDWQVCFQTYIDLYKLNPDPIKIARAIEVLDYQMSTPNKDYWWWADGLYMVMPVMTKLYNLTGNPLYLEKLNTYLAYAKEIMYDSDSKLFYRDAKYIYPKHKTANGKKDFWARGDGWVFAGLAKVLKDLPKTDKYRDEYVRLYKDMAAAIIACQQPQGYWTRSMLDPAQAPGPETSGTAFFTYGLLWGINNGYLDASTYMPAAKKGWNYLSSVAVQKDGKVGYVQPIGEKAIPGQVVDAKSTANFGVGAFLLAACEMVRYLDKPEQYPGWELVWNDEFNYTGKPDPTTWSYEHGFTRNQELQWYQPNNARCENGMLVLEARKEQVINPNFEDKSNDWRKNRKQAEYTSASIKTVGKKEFKYGRYEVRARIPVAGGSWPAIWTLGRDMEWPSCGEIDIMEYYRIKGKPHILANAAWGTDKKYDAKWNSKKIPFTHFTNKDKNWASKFHIWRMDWDESSIKLYLDNELLNEISLQETINGTLGNKTNPFMQPHYLLLNLAIGGVNGGEPAVNAFPMKYEIDYVRVYQKEQRKETILPGELWPDNNGQHINAHGGGILYHNGTYYWFGEHKSDTTSVALKGVTCYSSKDLYNWKDEGIVLKVIENDDTHDIAKGCILERPKVIYNDKTKQFVMWFHLELKGKGYAAARAAVAVSDKVTGPYRFVRSGRPNAGFWPADMPEENTMLTATPGDYAKWFTPDWRKAVEEGMFTRRDFECGQMSRDMTVFVDEDGKAYHIYSSEENLTLQIAELTDDYLNHTGKYIRVAPAGHNEAPAIFKKDGTYWMITSGCTGWDPNAARMFKASHILGPWEQLDNPCVGTDAELTFHSQSTYILPVQGKKDAFIFMADRWRPKHPSDARYIWLPIQFENGIPVLHWMDSWKLDFFDK